jgi:very-short-patch-repair endonuclease
MPRERDTTDVDRRIAKVAARQHGVVTTRQLEGAGVLSSGISNRTSAGRLHRLHRGVYAVGHPHLSNEGRWMAAVLACGAGAVLSHRSAAELWAIDRRARRLPGTAGRSASRPVDVTVPVTRGKRRRDGIRLHRSSTLTGSDCTRCQGIPVTTPGRTLHDLRRTLPSQVFASMLREAEFLGLPLGSKMPTDHTRSELEARLLRLARRHRLRKPEVNARVDRFVVDFLWRSERLIVEVDGWESHRSRSAFEEDRARDAWLKVLGYDVLRFTWRQIETDASSVAAAIRALLVRDP